MQNSHLQSGDALALGGANGVENKLKRKQPEDATSPRKTYGSLGGDIPVKKQKLEHDVGGNMEDAQTGVQS